MFFLLCKGLYLGFCVAVPVGPIGLICIRSGLVHGFRHCLSAGMGAACADAIYGIAATAGLGAAIMAYPQASIAIKYIGALFLIYLGTGIIRGGTPKEAGTESDSISVAKSAESGSHNGATSDELGLLRLFRSTMLLTLANPMTITSFVGMFAACGLGEAVDAGKSSIVVAGVFLGSAGWWLILALLLVGVRSALKERCSLDKLINLSRLSGVLIIIFGAWTIIDGLGN